MIKIKDIENATKDDIKSTIEYLKGVIEERNKKEDEAVGSRVDSIVDIVNKRLKDVGVPERFKVQRHMFTSGEYFYGGIKLDPKLADDNKVYFDSAFNNKTIGGLKIADKIISESNGNIIIEDMVMSSHYWSGNIINLYHTRKNANFLIYFDIEQGVLFTERILLLYEDIFFHSSDTNSIFIDEDAFASPIELRLELTEYIELDKEDSGIRVLEIIEKEIDRVKEKISSKL